MAITVPVKRRLGATLIALAATALSQSIAVSAPAIAAEPSAIDADATTTTVDVQTLKGGSVVADVPITAQLTTAEAWRPTGDATVTLRIPLPEYVTSIRVRLPELACPAAAPFIKNERFERAPDDAVRFPSGLEPLDSADFAVHATWAPFLAGQSGAAATLQGGSTLELDDIEDPGLPATFVLHCTGASDEGVALGAVTSPSPVVIGGALRHDLGLRAEARASIVEGRLPPGLVLGERGDLSGTVLPTKSGTFDVTVRLTDGSTSIDHRLSIVVAGGQVIEHVTKTTQLPNRSDVTIADQGCPAYFPWTISRQFHDPIWSAQKVPNGVRAVTHPGIVEVTSSPVVDNEGYTRGLMHIRANYRALSGEGAVHFVLYCTNDANAAGRR